MSERRRPAGEDGVTLVELLTVMAITALVLAFVGATIVHALAAQRRQTAQVSALNDSKLAFERVTRDIRGADPLHVAALDRVRLDIREAGVLIRTVTYAREENRLVVTDAATSQTRPLVGDLAPGWPLFLFHLVDGSTVTGASAINPRLVRSITVQLRVEPDGAGRVVDLTNRVLVRNAEQ
jgi:prepilin-type N-terminal cleavage/methylation domain-containing protein